MKCVRVSFEIFSGFSTVTLALSSQRALNQLRGQMSGQAIICRHPIGKNDRISRIRC